MRAEREKKYLLFILILALFFRLGFVFLVPMWQSADEYPHFYYVQYMAEYKTLPRFQPHFPNYECFQPPLYYLIGSVFYSILPGWDSDRGEMGKESLLEKSSSSPNVSNPMGTFLRLISVIFGMVTICLSYLSSKIIFPNNPEITLGTTAFVAFLPTFVSNTASISNDPLAVLLSVIIMFYLINQKSWNSKQVILFGVALGLAILTKYNLLALMPITFLVLYLHSPIKFWHRFLLAIFSTALISSFWFIHNLRVYHNILPITPGYPSGDFLWTRGLSEILHPVRNLFWSFWAAAGRTYQIHFPAWYYILIFGSLSLLAIIGLVRFSVESVRNKTLLDSCQKRTLVLLALYALLLVSGSLYYSLSHEMITSWGKNLFPGIFALGLFFVLGLANLNTKCREGVIFFSVLVLVISDLIFLFVYLIPQYY